MVVDINKSCKFISFHWIAGSSYHQKRVHTWLTKYNRRIIRWTAEKGMLTLQLR